MNLVCAGVLIRRVGVCSYLRSMVAAAGYRDNMEIIDLKGMEYEEWEEIVRRVRNE